MRTVTVFLRWISGIEDLSFSLPEEFCIFAMPCFLQVRGIVEIDTKANEWKHGSSEESGYDSLALPIESFVYAKRLPD